MDLEAARGHGGAMHIFTLWEKDASGQWLALMSFDLLEEAETLLDGWACEFVENYGTVPRQGFDFRLTRVVPARPGALDRARSLSLENRRLRPRSLQPKRRADRE